MFAEDLACALRQCAVYLAFDDAVVDHDTAIADRHIRHDPGESSARIDLDLGDMAIVWISRPERSPTHHRKELPLCEIGERYCLRRFAIAKLSTAIFNLRGLNAQFFGGVSLAPVDQFEGANMTGTARADHRARTARMISGEYRIANFLAHRDAFDFDFQHFCNDHRERGLMALAL